MSEPPKWTNDYGDIPWWYWEVAYENWRLNIRPIERRQRRRARAVTAAVLALAGGLGA